MTKRRPGSPRDDHTQHDEIYAAAKEVDLRKILEARRYDIKPDGFFRENPMRQERTASICIRRDNPARWHDFGSAPPDKKDGDLIDFLMIAEGMTRAEAREEAARMLDLTPGNARQSRRNRAPDPAPTGPVHNSEMLDRTVIAATTALAQSATEAATQARAYLVQRGLNPDGAAVQYARIGVIDDAVLAADSQLSRRLRNHLLLPYTDLKGNVQFYNTRAPADREGSAYRKQAGARQAGAFNGASVAGAATVIVVEGELDALAIMESLGPTTPVIATGGGGIGKSHGELLTNVKRVRLMFDSDPQGSEFTRESIESLRKLGIPAVPVDNMPETKDANEALVRYGPDALQKWLSDQLPQGAPRGDHLFLRTTFLEHLTMVRERPWAVFPSGIREFDQLLGGGYGPGIHVVAGRTGIGKTSLVLAVAFRSAMDGRHVVYLSLEQSKQELWARIASAELGLALSAFRVGYHKGADGKTQPLELAVQEHSRWPQLLQAGSRLHILEAGFASPDGGREPEISQLVGTINEVVSTTGAPPLVVIDYIQRMAAPQGALQDARQRVGHNIGELQVRLVRDRGCAVIAVSSISRAFYGPIGSRNRDEDLLASLKESGDLEFTASTVAVLHTAESDMRRSASREGSRPNDPCHNVTVSLIKNREGPVGSFVVPWSPQSNSWGNEHTADPLSHLLKKR
jgi:replicative DNA helicase